MSVKLKTALIELGYQRKDLRAELAPIIDVISSYTPEHRTVEKLKQVIMDMPQAKFSFDDIYMSDALDEDIMDLDLYQALDELVQERKLRGMLTSDDNFHTHQDLQYRKASTKSAGWEDSPEDLFSNLVNASSDDDGEEVARIAARLAKDHPKFYKATVMPFLKENITETLKRLKAGQRIAILSLERPGDYDLVNVVESYWDLKKNKPNAVKNKVRIYVQKDGGKLGTVYSMRNVYHYQKTLKSQVVTVVHIGLI